MFTTIILIFVILTISIIISILYKKNTRHKIKQTSSIIKNTKLPYQIITSNQHPILQKDIYSHALRIVNTLTNHDYEAYIVGGCIRDLYTSITPKDFDIVTNATPHEIQKLFKNSRIIGRRFKLVHILFGREFIEVATFRKNHDTETAKSEKASYATTGRILRDNVFGSIEDDVIRRDFTINALYYDAKNNNILDFYNSVSDIKQKIIKMIGDPKTRYNEDPVRMLRAIRFKAKLNFTIHTDTENPIYELGYLLKDIPAARLYDELIKLLQSGEGFACLKYLQQYNLLKYLLFDTESYLDKSTPNYENFINEALNNTDQRIKNNKSVNPAFLFSVFLWIPLQKSIQEKRKLDVNLSYNEALYHSAQEIIFQQSQYTVIPKRINQTITNIWQLQRRLISRSSKHIEDTINHPKFRAAYDFLLLQQILDKKLQEACQWWTEFQNISYSERQHMIEKNKKKTIVKKNKHFNKKSRLP